MNIAAGAVEPDLATDRDGRWFWDALQPYSSNSGGYVNFITDADDERVRASYGAAG